MRLYVVGMCPRSTTAYLNLVRICEAHVSGRYRLDVVDIRQHPEAVREYGVLAIPTAVRIKPPPPRRIVGDLSDIERVLDALAIRPPMGRVR